MVNNYLWSSSDRNTNFIDYINYLKKNNLHNYSDYFSLHKWSVNNKEIFWKSIWDFTKIKGKYLSPIINEEDNFIKSTFFKNSKLNFANNLIKRNDYKDAIVFFSEKKISRRVSWKQLGNNVNKIANYFKKQNINQGDRVVAVLPNLPETIISFLGTAKIGAIWSSCSADFGTNAIIDRFKQISPKILIISDYYYYNNKKINTLNKIEAIKKEITSIKKIIIIPYLMKKINYDVKFKYENWLSILDKNSSKFKEKKFDFNIPLYILYSSGTTGEPKCIVHGAGGSLIQHKKEHQIHCNIKPNDKVFYFTTCGWMMWNWLVTCLSSDAIIYLYDGSPFIPTTDYLFRIIENENITFFGVSAKYLDTLKQKNINIKKNYNLSKLKTIASTGSPLIHETFNYVYKYIKKHVHLCSISGGTDIVSCFVLGNPNLPVNIGEIQCKGLGMDVAILDEKGNSIQKKKGELVCLSTFPSKPIYFWNDDNNKKLIKTYFSKYPNVWHHGDFAEITSNNGIIIYGRSDSTLNPGGIRMGTAELYRVVESIKDIVECIAAEQKYKNDNRVILFVKLNNNKKLNIKLINTIKNQIKILLSPKHIPAIILQVSDIPKTKNGKIVEITIKKIINNEEVTNLNSLANPGCLKDYNNRKELRTDI